MTVQQEAQPQPRAQRECDDCHAVDDAGHHQVAFGTADGLEVVSRHFRCCAAAGCPDGSCYQMTATGATPGV